MRLAQFSINQFRNLLDVQFDASSGVNLITGQNASGKTSLLEAIYYLSHIRSFRTQHVSDLINHQHKYFELVARLHHQNEQRIPVGIRRSRQKLVARMNQQDIRRVADIAASFPVLAIHPDSYRLITAGPGERRQFIDWGVFHVEHDFFDAWQRYRRALKQRNSAIRAGQQRRLCRMWDNELVTMAEHIHRLRTSYMAELQPVLNRLIKEFFPGKEIQCEYGRGWSEESDLADLLEQRLTQDMKRGYTSVGPQRADLKISVAGQSAQTGISRGQQKMLVALLRLGQAMQFSDKNNRPCVLLYDDLPSELDEENRARIMHILRGMRIQLFITAIEPEQLDLSAWKYKKMFHVEHGKLSELV